jgi:hypothetical protein
MIFSFLKIIKSRERPNFANSFWAKILGNFVYIGTHGNISTFGDISTFDDIGTIGDLRIKKFVCLKMKKHVGVRNYFII